MNQSNIMKQRFQTVVRQLTKKTWFKKDKWLTSVHVFSPDQTSGTVIFQVYKKRWMNDEHRGIRFECYLDLTDHKQKKTSLALHFFNPEKNSNTSYENVSLQRNIIDLIYPIFEKWNDYKLHESKYNSQPFLKFFNIDENFENLLFFEIEKVCTELGPLIDQALLG